MGRKSSIKKLPKELRQVIDEKLRDGGHTLDQIIAHLRQLGCEDVSRSALGRYKQDYDQVASRLRESREMADSLMAELGPAVTEGKQGRMLIEATRALLFDMMMPQLRGDASADANNALPLQTMAKAIRDLAAASRSEQDFEAKIRERVRAEEREALEAEMRAKLADAEGAEGDEDGGRRASLAEARRILFGAA